MLQVTPDPFAKKARDQSEDLAQAVSTLSSWPFLYRSMIVLLSGLLALSMVILTVRVALTVPLPW